MYSSIRFWEVLLVGPLIQLFIDFQRCWRWVTKRGWMTESWDSHQSVTRSADLLTGSRTLTLFPAVGSNPCTMRQWQTLQLIDLSGPVIHLFVWGSNDKETFAKVRIQTNNLHNVYSLFLAFFKRVLLKPSCLAYLSPRRTNHQLKLSLRNRFNLICWIWWQKFWYTILTLPELFLVTLFY